MPTKPNLYKADINGTYSILNTFTSPAGGYFRGSVNMDDSNIIIGAPNGASAYIYSKDDNGSFSFNHELISGSSPVSGFGLSVAINGNYALVGGKNNINANRVHVFEKNTTGQFEWNSDFTSSIGGIFGNRIDFDGEYALVGAIDGYHVALFHNEHNGTFSEVDAWNEASAGNNYGYGIALDEKNLLVGNYPTNQVYAYTFERNDTVTDEFSGGSVPITPECCGYESNGTVLTDNLASVTVQNNVASALDFNIDLAILDLKPDEGNVTKFTPFTLYMLENNLSDLTLQSYSPYAELTQNNGVVSLEFTRSGEYNITLKGTEENGTVYGDVSTFNVLNSAPISKDGNYSVEAYTEM